MCGTVDFTAATMANSDAKRLYDNLLRKSGYNKLIRPVMNNTDKLIVKLGLRLSQLIDVVRIHYSTLGCRIFFPHDVAQTFRLTTTRAVRIELFTA